MTRADLHRLIDELPESSVDEAAVVLSHLNDPMVAKHYTAPWDDEALSPDDLAALGAAERDAERGDVAPIDQVMREADAAD